MAAINAAGYNTDLASPSNHPLRKQVRDVLASKNIPSLEGIKKIYAEHPDLGPYISFALICEHAPSFAVRQQRGVDIVPPDVGPLLKLSPLLAAFYREANIPDLWARAQPAINQYIARYHQPVADAVFTDTIYLRQQTSGNGRHFQIYVELLAGPNQVHSRSYGYNDYTVITPSAEVRSFEVRHSYLHYLLDPLAAHEQELLYRKKPILDLAQRAPALPELYKADVVAMASESMVKAVEARLDKNPGAATAALKQGFILVPYFSEQLVLYEQQELAMNEFYIDMVKNLDVTVEDKRLAGVQFDSRPAEPRSVHVAYAAPAAPVLTGIAKTIADADDAAYQAHDLAKAKQLYLQAVEQAAADPERANAYFGLGRIAAQQKDPETAETMFKKVLDLQPEPAPKAWSLYYLGSLALATEDPDLDEAKQRFEDAIKVEGAPEAAKKAAQQALLKLLAK